MHFERQDLENTSYSWTDNNKDLFTGPPSRRLFDRRNGNQVLFLINLYGLFLTEFTKQAGKSIEKKIQYDLPESVKSELSVFNWLRYTSVPF